MTTLALVAQSARAMAEAAVADGYAVIAIDVFGDTDTRRASQSWFAAGTPGTLQLDPAQVLATLRTLAQRGGVAGWVAGGGCEGLPDLLSEGAALLPLFGTAPQAVQRVRDPAEFFGFLQAAGIAHPEVRHTAPADGSGWLLKDSRGCGGWHILHAGHAGQAGQAGHAGNPAPHQPGQAPLPAPQYYQRLVPGTAMSATFCANGHQAVLLGINQQLVRAIGARPFVYAGVLGPLGLPDAAATALDKALQTLSAEFVLRGLGSLDFVLDGDSVQVLEINPRPPASLALYGTRLAGGLMAAHVQACLQGRLPMLLPAPGGTQALRGTAIVFAPRAVHIDETAAQALQAMPACHDLPLAGTQLQRGDPLCSVSAAGPDAAAVRAQLNTGRETVLKTLEATR
jgi:predicted ATP-grasp superfamily ATP-dependent carboligase